MQRLAIIGASYLQEPLIQKAKSMGLETHVFAWASGDVGEKSADYFYPISVTEKDKILAKCQELNVDGVCTIASDLASITVNYVAEKMRLTGNSLESTYLSTNKHAMRECFYSNNDPAPQSYLVQSIRDLQDKDLTFPLIVKPPDRSGSRGITKLESEHGLETAINYAKELSFAKQALVEEFVDGTEYSVECISWHGEHTFLMLTKKYTTGAPRFIETGHLQPAIVAADTLEQVKRITFHALDSLQIKNGASHTELKITPDGKIMIIEIGGRMGGDFIGSHLVEYSAGIDFVKGVIQIALGQIPDLSAKTSGCAAVRFILSEEDVTTLSLLKKKFNKYLVFEHVEEDVSGETVDSLTRHGYFLLKADSVKELEMFMPEG